MRAQAGGEPRRRTDRELLLPPKPSDAAAWNPRHAAGDRIPRKSERPDRQRADERNGDEGSRARPAAAVRDQRAVRRLAVLADRDRMPRPLVWGNRELVREKVWPRADPVFRFWSPRRRSCCGGLPWRVLPAWPPLGRPLLSRPARPSLSIRVQFMPCGGSRSRLRPPIARRRSTLPATSQGRSRPPTACPACSRRA